MHKKRIIIFTISFLVFCKPAVSTLQTTQDFLQTIQGAIEFAAQGYKKLGETYGEYQEVGQILAEIALGFRDLIQSISRPDNYTALKGAEIIRDTQNLIKIIQTIETRYAQPVDDPAFTQRELIRQIGNDLIDEIKKDFNL